MENKQTYMIPRYDFLRQAIKLPREGKKHKACQAYCTILGREAEIVITHMRTFKF